MVKPRSYGRACAAVMFCISASLSVAAIGDELMSVTRSVLAKKSLSNVPDKEGQIVLVTVPPGASTGKHSHPVDEFVYVLEGEGQLSRPDTAATSVRVGETMVLASGQVHEMKNSSASSPLKFLQFSVPTPGQPLAVPVP